MESSQGKKQVGSPEGVSFLISRTVATEQFRNILTTGTALRILNRCQPLLVRICWALLAVPFSEGCRGSRGQVAAAGQGIPNLIFRLPHIFYCMFFFCLLWFFFILKFGKLLFILLVLIMDYPCCIIKAVYASSHLILSVMTTVKRVVTSHTNEEMSSRKFPKILAHPRTHSWYMVGLGCEPRFDEWRYIQAFYLHNLNIFRLMCFL